MSAGTERPGCRHLEHVPLLLLDALEHGQRSVMQAHVRDCAECRQEVEALAPVLDGMAYWPSDVVRPPASLWERLASRIAADPPEGATTRATKTPGAAPGRAAAEVGVDERAPEWEQPAPGIECKLLAAEAEADGGRISMLVRLAPGAAYPPHRHAAVEELHLLDGELWIDDRKLYPGDYNRAEPGTADERVWSETGCTCVLIASSRDILR